MSNTDEFRYGFYLRPDLKTSIAISQMHRVLRAQYGLIAGGLFMPHATIKGFYKSEATPQEMIARLDKTLVGFKPFLVYNGGPILMGPRGVVTSWRDLPNGERNPGLDDIQDRAFEALLPLIPADCKFTAVDPRGKDGPKPFHAHITLAMADIEPHMREEVLGFVKEGGMIGSGQFLANTYHLFRFKADWQGAWWHTLTWELLHSWQF